MLTVTIQGADVSANPAVVRCACFGSTAGLFSTGVSGKSFNSDPNKSREDFSAGMVDSSEKVFSVVTAALLVVAVGVASVPATEKLSNKSLKREIKFSHA